MNTHRCICTYLHWFGCWVALWLLTGCASTQSMALEDEQAQVEVGDDAIVLLRMHTVNELKPGYPPAVLAIHVVDEATQESVAFKPRARLISLHDGYEYLVSLRLPPGRYEISSMTGMSFGYHIQAHFEVPLHRRVTVPGGKVLYLGRIEARNVARIRDDQPPAGPLLPLIDQAVTGYSDGTFQVEILNLFKEDMRLFQHVFPALNSLPVESMPL
ncbi:MAG: hypothetical protein COX57_00430 [Alphaproteobacteria bacterium CG_4_10_14_0_2_um_filter_63_37]|nr:MAG: hypothetical protein AUJ55_05540 [Proteobacteria bacterium CG1_02_64_396]PJA26014.1 MAG: hypothetical protein COX57_00430 [Alphaproteobacteria bacterium CG_4_10_14_0_2_um_filter_63_37]